MVKLHQVFLAVRILCVLLPWCSSSATFNACWASEPISLQRLWPSAGRGFSPGDVLLPVSPLPGLAAGSAGHRPEKWRSWGCGVLTLPTDRAGAGTRGAGGGWGVSGCGRGGSGAGRAAARSPAVGASAPGWAEAALWVLLTKSCDENEQRHGF